MRLNRLWMMCLLACLAAAASQAARAEGAGEARARQTAHRTKAVDFSSLHEGGEPARIASPVPYFPIAPDTEFKRHVVRLGDGDRDSGAAGAGENLNLVYNNVNGRFVQPLQRDALLADELTLTAKPGCKLRRYTFQVSGRADPTRIGGPFQVNFALYNSCPGASGLAIAGTSGSISFPDDSTREVIVDITDDVTLSRSTVWLGVRFSRENCGVILGTPPLQGYSGDVYDFPLLHCQGNLGGFPQAPHASFNAQVYTDAACPAFVGYRNLDPFPPGHAFGAETRFADDVQMAFTDCDLVGYEIGVKGTAAYSVQLYRSSVGMPSTPIANTDFSFVAIGNEAQIFHFAIDPPISLSGSSPGIQLFAALRPNSPTGRWIRTRSAGQVGSTTESVAVDINTDPGGAPIWELRFPDDDDPTFNGFYAVLLCEGDPPVGACCDMFVRDAQNESVCRTVPEMNCPFPPRNSTLRPSWREGVPCRVCDGGCRDGLSCDTDGECAGGPDGVCFDNICSGGCNDLAPCATDEDCAGAADGTCVDNEPFSPDPPCGKSACCTPQDTCINLTQRECNEVEPLFRERQWQRGQYCGRQGQRCPDSACLGRIGSCTEARDRICNGGDADGSLCSGNDNECRGICVASVCIGGCHDGASCSFNSHCNCDGQCSDIDPNNPVCIGGARDGEFCDPLRGDRDCLESFCERFPGCNDADCCTAVCDFGPGFPLFTEFCCQTEWDNQCAELARNPDAGIEECQALLDPNDTCAPTIRTEGAAVLEIGSSALAGGKSTPRPQARRPDLPSSDPGFCCHQGFRVCEGGCTPGAECMVDADCPGTAAGICGANNFCEGGCNDGGSCVDNDDCLGATAGMCVLPPTPEPGTTGEGTHWYRLDIPPATEPDEPETVSLQFDTCSSPGSPTTWDSLIQVYSIVDSDRGRCLGLGRCADTTVCGVDANDCADGSTCSPQTLPCSVEQQDCPLNALCEFDLTAACARNTSLAAIACNDDAADGCDDPNNKGRLSKLCVDGLNKGETYLVMVGAKTGDNVVDYRLRVTAAGSCPGTGAPANDSCPNAAPFPYHPTIPGSREFDLTEASWDCEPGEPSCPSMQNDLWWQYRPAFNGRVTFEACGPDNPSTPDTCLAIYEGCECPPLLDVPESCVCLNLGNPQCQQGARIAADVVGGQCYTVRLSDNRGTRGTGTLTGQFELDDCNGNGIADNCEISCGAPGGICDIPGCGTKNDCQPNGFPDECDIPPLCSPAERTCSTDFNGDGRPDECPNCPAGVVEYLDPPHEVIAASYPTTPGGSCTAQGIQTIVATAAAGAEALCWRLCETDDNGSPNFVTDAVENPPGTYTITLSRPITPGQCTTITYRDNDDVNHVGTFTALPGDVNGDRITNLDDLTFLIDVLMGSEIAPWGAYSSDIDGNGVSVFPDMLGLVDLLDGNGPCFAAWDGAGAPSCDACAPAP